MTTTKNMDYWDLDDKKKVLVLSKTRILGN